MPGSNPVHFAIAFPVRISIEHGTDYEALKEHIDLHFHGSDGSRLTVRLSQEQAEALAHWDVERRNPQKMAVSLYVTGHIELEEFERRIGPEELSNA